MADTTFRPANFPDATEFFRVMGEIEHEAVDFKEKAEKRIQHTIAAMAMSVGGVVVLGIANDRTIVGCMLDQATTDTVNRAARDCAVDVDIAEFTVGDTTLCAVNVPEVRGRIVTTSSGRILRRSGSDSVPLLGDEVARFVRERTEHNPEDDLARGLDFTAFDLGLISEALIADGKDPITSADQVARALEELDLAARPSVDGDPVPLKAAAILFYRDPREVIRGASVQAVKREGVGPSAGPTGAREEIFGPLPEVIERTIRFIERHSRQYQTVVGTRREPIPEYPIRAIREAVLNAVAHRDFGRDKTTVDITIWDDRVQIKSPGSLPGYITLDNIRSEHYSRNRRLMRVLKLLRLVEEYGEGIDRIYEEVASRLMDEPEIVANQESVAVVLHSRSDLGIEDQAWLMLLGRIDMTPGERLALATARREGAVTPRRLRLLNAKVFADETLGTAVSKGLLKKIGQGGGTQYVLSEEVVMRTGSSAVEAQNRIRQRLMDEVRRRGSISTTEAAALLEVAVPAARDLLNRLVSSEELVARGRTRGRRYFRRS